MGMPFQQQLARCERIECRCIWPITVMMTSDRRLEAQEQTFKAQKEALDNIQQMLAQLLTNQNNNDAGSNHNEKEHNDDKQPKTEK